MHEKLVEISRNYNYTIGKLLGFSYHQNCYKLIGVDLSRETNTNVLRQINFEGKTEEQWCKNPFYR